MTLAVTPAVAAVETVAGRPTVRAVGVLVVAAVLDATLGEPPTRWHPVVLVGRYLDATARLVPAAPAGRAVVAGAAAWSVGALATTAVALAWRHASRRLPWPVGVPAEAVVLWTLFSGRLLLREVAAVEDALVSGDGSLQRGRERVARICSRDTRRLDTGEVRATALESLAENLADSVVAPLLAHAVAGLPGAAAYRYANTADAMWGYRDERWQHAGRMAARVDDVLNLLPARATAVLLAPQLLVEARLRRAVREQARVTPSPNGGWPMAAMALRLGVRLAKPGVYELNPAGRLPGTADTRRALALARQGVVAAVALAAVVRVGAGVVRGLAAPDWGRR